MNKFLFRGSGTRSTVALITVAVLAVGACGDDDGTPIGPSIPSIHVDLGFAAVTVVQGQSKSVNVVVFRDGGYTGAVTLAVTGAPEGMTAELDPVVVSEDMWGSSLTVAVDATVPPGAYSLTITGSGAGVDSESATLRVNVASLPPSFTLELTHYLFQIAQGQSGTVGVTVSRQGAYAGTVSLAVTGLPTGVAAEFEPTAVPLGTPASTLTFTIGAAAAPGTYQVTITGTGPGSATRSATMSLSIIAGPAPAISVWFIPDDAIVFTVQGDTWTWPGVYITRGAGYTGPVELSIEGLPAGVTASLDPSTLTGDTVMSSVSFTATASAPVGITTVTIRAKGIGVPDATTTFRFAVAPPAS